MSGTLFESSIPSLRLLNRGKVLDLYEVDAEHLLIVTTDRLSAFDVILPTPIADKGRVLTQLSAFWFRSKVLDLYEVDAEHLLIVTTDRLSAFDVILPTPIADKGRVLTQLSAFWFGKLGHLIPNQLTAITPESVVRVEERAQVAGRAIVVKRYKPLPVEAVARGYIEGSGWKDYQATGTICGIKLPAGLKRASRLPEPLFTPSTKAPMDTPDENID